MQLGPTRGMSATSPVALIPSRTKRLQSKSNAARPGLILACLSSSPDDAEINYQTAFVHETLGGLREAIRFDVRAIEQRLSGNEFEGARSKSKFALPNTIRF
jgi:hypothetical protein